MRYRRTAFFGVSWMMLLNVISGGLSVVKIAIVARLLSPADFGILGIALLSLALLELLTETGVNVVLIQPGRKIAEYLDSAWIVSILRGLVVCLLLIAFSPIVGNFFHSPRSVIVVAALGFVPLLRGFINPTEVIFQKELRFNYEFFFRISIVIVDALTAIILVLITKSILSLVFGMAAGVSLELFISFVFIKPTPKLRFNKKYLLEIFHKGKWITLYGLFNYIGQNIDNIFVGRILGTYSLGIYEIAYKIGTFTITEITDVVNLVFFPLYSNMHSNNHSLKKSFLKSVLALSIIVIPISIIIYIFSKEIVLLFLGSKWLGVVDVLNILVFYGMLRSIIGFPSSLFLATNNQRYVAYMTFSRALALTLVIVPFIYFFGLIGAAYAAISSVIVEFPIVMYLIFKVFIKE